MKYYLGWSSALMLSLMPFYAQEKPDTDKLNQLLQKMQEKQENLEKMLRDQKNEIESLKQQLDRTRTNAPPGVATNFPAPPPTPTAIPTAEAPAPALEKQPWSPASPIRFGTPQNYIGISFDGLFAAGGSTVPNNDIPLVEPGGHDPKQNGFTVQNLETVFDGKVDPYFRGQANIVLQIDTEGETTIEAEEAYLESLSLPWNLQVKAGLFFTEFGRLNPQHPHAWDFVDDSLVNARLLGPDGLRGPGARISWLAPTPFYSELYLAVQNSQGETAFSFDNSHEGETFMGRPAVQQGINNGSDLIYVPRYAASFNLSDAQTLVAGTSAAFGPNSSGDDTDTQIYGLDFFYKWKSPNQHAGFPFVTWQTEAMFRRFQAGAFAGDATIPALPAETIKDWGLYTQVAYGFKKGWVAALRGDYVAPISRAQYEDIVGTDPQRAVNWRISPNLTYYFSEFSKIRLQYNLEHRDGFPSANSVWLQWEFLLGTHAAHKF
jgi:hypothetical protein